MAKNFILFNKKSSIPLLYAVYATVKLQITMARPNLHLTMEMIVFETVLLRMGTRSVTARTNLQTLVVVYMHKNYIKQPNYEFGRKS